MAEQEYPGIDRLNYFLANVGMIALIVFVVNVFGPESQVVRLTGLGIMIAGVIIDVMRLRNMGVSQWLVFVRYLPFGGTLLWMALTSAQTGWNETRQLDTAGKSILFVQVALFLIIIFIAWRSGITFFGFPGFGYGAF